MNGLNLSNNIIRLRREHKLTQEELADFVGVTKASVSKWENAQSMPDILLLPQLAAFFGVTIDELIGYEPQLSSEQIRKCYAQLSKDFVSLPFEEALEKTRTLAHRYYSCYPLLLQLAILYLNHFMLTEGEESRRILQEAAAWCDRILEKSGDVALCNEALVLRAGLDIQLGQAADAIDLLEPFFDTGHIFGQHSTMLVQAYQMNGESRKAKTCAQVEQYRDLLGLVNDAVQLLSLYGDDVKRCKDIIRRTRSVIEIYQLESLQPNLAAQFYYQSAVVYGSNGKKEEALEALAHFEKCAARLLDAEEITLHGDRYFDLLDTWIDRLPLGNMAPRDKSFIRKSMQGALGNPAFEELRAMERFRRIIHLYE